MLDQPLSEDETLLKKKCCPLEAFSIMCWELWQILKLCTVHQTRDTAFSKVALVLLKVILLKPDISFRFISNSWADFSKNTQKELRKR
jgi:hypothetical protein